MSVSVKMVMISESKKSLSVVRKAQVCGGGGETPGPGSGRLGVTNVKRNAVWPWMAWFWIQPFLVFSSETAVKVLEHIFDLAWASAAGWAYPVTICICKQSGRWHPSSATSRGAVPRQECQPDHMACSVLHVTAEHNIRKFRAINEKENLGISGLANQKHWEGPPELAATCSMT